MTGADAGLFTELGPRADHLHVADGRVTAVAG
jgi:hypothetical protein